LGLVLIALGGFAQNATPPAPDAFGFAAGLNLGTDVIVDSTTGEKANWTKLAFQPDIALGKFGVGLDLTLHFQLYKDNQTPFTIYAGDWIPPSGHFLDVYLPKILYVRYGLKGEDPLYAKLGSISDLTLGNGFIMGEYSNMSFLPTSRHLGLEFGLDGNLFKFPFVGVELAAGNLAQFDVFGGRLYTRPLLGTSIPILKNAEIGVTFVTDTKPDLYAHTTATAAPISVGGADIRVPILTGKAFPLMAFGDLAFEPNKSFGAMIGAGGRLISFITYGAQLRLMQDGFIPDYFDSNYDLYRAAKFDYMQNTLADTKALTPAWFSTLGFALLGDKLLFNARLDGPFKAIDKSSANQADFPHAKVILSLAEGILGGFYLDASYEKYYIGRANGFFKDLVDPLDAIIGMSINYKTGASVLTLKYNARYDPTIVSTDITKQFVITSSITATMKF
jgi:hypothetical protein